MDRQFLFHWPVKLRIMRAFLNYIKHETLNEIKTSLENLWRRTIQLSDFFPNPLVFIAKQKCLVGASQIGCGELEWYSFNY